MGNQEFNKPSEEHRTPAEVVQAARQMLVNVELGLEDIVSDNPIKRAPGMHNVAVFGRSVTVALQRLKNITTDFDAWYSARVPLNDPFLKYFNNLRNEILKESVFPKVETAVHIDQFSGNANQLLEGTPTRGATGVFIGEGKTGGSGWIVSLPDGTEEKYYASLSPSFQGNVSIHLKDAPTTFLGEEYGDSTVASVAGAYVGWLRNLVEDAAKKFA